MTIDDFDIDNSSINWIEEDLLKKDWYIENRKVNPVILGRGILVVYHPKKHFVVTKDDKEIWMYNGQGYYEPTGKDFIDDKIQMILQKDYNTYIRNTVIDWITKIGDLWVDREVFDSNINLINLKNGIYNLEDNTFLEHDPKYYLTNQLPITYNPDAKIDKIKDFLESTLYPEDIDIIQELAGYLFYRHHHIHKAFMFDGEGSNGKSTLINLLCELIGENNVSNVSLQDLCYRPFLVSNLYGKLANVYSDIPDKSLNQTGLFKILTGQDYLYAERKFKTPIQFKNYAKLIFSTNQIPSCRDDTTAYFRRWIIISFPNTFEGNNCKENLIDEITTEDELSGMFNWAIEGLNRLLKDNKFSYSKSTEKVREEMLLKSNPIKSFVENHIEYDPDSEETKEDVYACYVEYCEAKKVTIKANNIFGREIKMYIPRIASSQRADGKRVWRGMRLDI